MFRRYFSIISAVLFLSSCGYAIEESHQDFTLLTPGAENARCYVYVDNVKFQMYPPQTINMMKSHNDMKIDCMAPGNRDKTIAVPAKMSERAIWGTPVGMAWDFASKSLYHYPAVVAVDFSKNETKPFKLPKHNSSDIMKPEDHLLEEILPAAPRMNKDRHETKEGLYRKGDEPGASDGVVMDKGSLVDVIDRLQTPEATTESTAGSSDGVPTKIYPGE